MTYPQDPSPCSPSAQPQANLSADFGAALPLLRELMDELDLASLLEPDTDASSPTLLSDLKTAIADVVSICEVLADRSLDKRQLDALGGIEVRAQSLQCAISDFIHLFERE